MDNWISSLNSSVLEWLLEESAPSVRYHTMKYLLDRPEDAELKSAKKAIMETGTAPAMLERMRGEEYSNTLPEYYRDKYKGLSWQLLILAELGADGENAQIKKLCEYLFANSQERESGGFSIDTSVKYGGGRKSTVIPCLTGNMIFALSRLGYSGDKRVLRAAEWLADNQRYDDGDGAPSSLPACWGNHSCYMGAVKALKGFAGLPRETRSASIGESIERGAEFLLKHRVYKQSRDLLKPMKPGWMKFSFPLMYQTDALEMLLILSELGIRDERMQDALNLVVSKQNENGTWTSQNNLKGKLLAEPGRDEQDKWVTLRALRVLKYYNPEGEEQGR